MFFRLTSWWLLFGGASVLTILLAIRESHRPRLLKSPHATVLTLLAFVTVVGWVGVLLVVLVVIGWLAFLASLVGSFLVGIVAHAVLRPRNVLAQFEEMDQQDRDALQSALRRHDVRDTLETLSLAPEDLNSLLVRLRLLGVGGAQAAKAIRSPELIRWYFRRVPSFSTGDAIFLAMWAHDDTPPRDVD